MSSDKIRVGLVGASGYGGEELLRVLALHPRVDLSVLTSRSLVGKRADDLVAGLPESIAWLPFENLGPAEIQDKAEAFFLALPHGVAAEYAVPLVEAGKVVFDLSADFRVSDPAVYAEFYGEDHPAPELLPQAVYGMPELHREAIRNASLIASPGCYPTSIILALAPALQAGLIDTASIVVNSMSGVSGAGRKADISLLFSELNESLKAYGVPKHRHLSEIEQELSGLAGTPVVITFIPHLVPVTRGIHTTISATLRDGQDPVKVQQAYEKFCKNEPFVRLLTSSLPETRRVLRSNRIEIATRIDERTGRLLLFSAEDNLGKGAGLQAVQSFNIRFGIAEATGLQA